MHHFTLTVTEAGAPYCGCDRATGHTYSHVPYVTSADQLGPDFPRPICPDCLTLAFGTEAEVDAAYTRLYPVFGEGCSIKATNTLEMRAVIAKTGEKSASRFGATTGRSRGRATDRREEGDA